VVRGLSFRVLTHGEAEERRIAMCEARFQVMGMLEVRG
jgi:hypothetical protein